jgi:hypothetical protein
MNVRRSERASLVGMGLGTALMLQPWWMRGMAVGFAVVLACVVAQNVLGRLERGGPSRKGDPGGAGEGKPLERVRGGDAR